MNDMQVVEAQLARVLAFFPRVDTKASGLFAINSAMLTIAALNVKPADIKLWFVGTPAILTVLGLVTSYLFLYRCNFPERRGGEGSLIYFVEIQKRTEANFIADFEATNDADYRQDLLGQIWRNSQILCSKYNDVAMALRCTLASFIPFAALLSSTSYLHSVIPVVQP